MSASIVRLLTLGDSGARISSLLLQYTPTTFSTDYMPTIGIDFRTRTSIVKGKKVPIYIGPLVFTCFKVPYRNTSIIQRV